MFFGRPRSDGWPHHGRTFFISSVILIDFSTGVLFTSWCCPSRPDVVFFACVHMALFLALSLSPGKFLVSSWCDYSMLVSLLYCSFVKNHSFVFLVVNETRRIFHISLISKASIRFFILSECPAITYVRCYRPC